jgi:hypothetical protein
MKAAFLLTICLISFSSTAQWFILDTVNTNYWYGAQSYADVIFEKPDTILKMINYSSGSPSTSSSSTIFRTVNDCENWSGLFGYSDPAAHLYDFDFPSFDTGFVSYNYWAHSLNERTFDGGDTWELITAFGPTILSFVSGKIGYGMKLNKLFKYKNDSFSDIGYFSVVSFSNADIFFSKEREGFIICDYQHLLRTTDDCQTWNTLFYDTARLIYDFTFLNDSTYFLSCDDGWIFNTTDSGQTWQSYHNDTLFVGGTCFFSETNWVVPGYSIYQTYDAGVTWKKHGTPSDIRSIRNVVMFNDTIGYAETSVNAAHWSYHIMSYDIILKTENGGFSKELVFTTTPIDSVQIYPNPFVDYFNILIDPNSDATSKVFLFTIQGQIIFEKSVKNSTAHKIETVGLPLGVYLVKIEGTDKPISYKIVKTRY